MSHDELTVVPASVMSHSHETLVRWREKPSAKVAQSKVAFENEFSPTAFRATPLSRGPPLVTGRACYLSNAEIRNMLVNRSVLLVGDLILLSSLEVVKNKAFAFLILGLLREGSYKTAMLSQTRNVPFTDSTFA